MSDIDLSLVPMDKLADELVKRGEAGIVIIRDIGPDKLQYINWVGDYHMALGLCTDMQRVIIKECYERE